MIRIIAAVSSNGVIGNAGDLVFKDKEDMKFFRETTSNNIVIMGRKTFESIGRALPNRTNIVLTKSTETEVLQALTREGLLISHDLENILNTSLIKNNTKDTFIIGGGEIYKQAMEFADELIISHFPQEVEGDVFFPEIDLNIWEVKEEIPFTNFTVKKYKRKK